MLDRASTFRDRAVIDLLKNRFVPVAVDLFPLHRGQDAESVYYRTVANQGPRKVPQNTQGLYTFAPDGKLLGFTHRAHELGDRAVAVREMLEKALADFQPADLKIPEKKDVDPSRVPPQDGLVLDVSAKVLGGYRETKDEWEKMFQTGMGLDHLWVRRDEAADLARGSFPESLQRRIARFNLIDNTRGEPPMWDPGEIRALEMKLQEGRIAGKVSLRSDSGDRGAELDLLGFLDVKEGRVVRLDLVAKGHFWERPAAGSTAPPEGKYPVAIAFRLIEGEDEAHRVPPQGRRDWDYLK